MKETFKRFEQKNEGTLSAAFSFVLKPLKWDDQQQVVHWKLVDFQTDNGESV